ncbi:MAG TPA: hypothetical protein VF814_08960 [Casimicrobiaceae bacterium]
MQFDWSTFVLQTVNFAVLVWLLHRFLYKPVLRAVDARREAIDKQYADAGKAEARAKEVLGAVEAERGRIAAERVAVLEAAAAQAEEAAAARRTRAEHEATALLEEARKALGAEREQALAEARRAALDLGAQIAGRLLAAVSAELQGDAWMERVVRHLATLPQAERAALVEQVAHGAALKVVTASSLSAQGSEAWRARLRRSLGDGIAVAFEVDPQLVAGAELHFPNAVLRFSWQSAVASARAEIEGHGEAR